MRLGEADAPMSLSESVSVFESESASASESPLLRVEWTLLALGYLNRCAKNVGACPRRDRKNRKRLLM